MASDPLRDHQRIAFEALKIVKKICEENNITYFLLAGSTLGAVRHGGFIPWDDDIDVGMKLEDIVAFHRVAENYDFGKFKLSCCDSNERHPRFFSKIIYQGRHCVDIFPIVKTSNNPLQRRYQWLMKKFWFRIYWIRNSHGNPKSKFKKLLQPAIEYLIDYIPREWIIKQARRNEARFENHEGNFYMNINSIYTLEQELIKQEWIESLSEQKFEGEMFPIFSNAHAYLSHLYGDYMTPPPPEERFASHKHLRIECD